MKTPKVSVVMMAAHPIAAGPGRKKHEIFLRASSASATVVYFLATSVSIFAVSTSLVQVSQLTLPLEDFVHVPSMPES